MHIILHESLKHKFKYLRKGIKMLYKTVHQKMLLILLLRNRSFCVYLPNDSMRLKIAKIETDISVSAQIIVHY